MVMNPNEDYLSFLPEETRKKVKDAFASGWYTPQFNAYTYSGRPQTQEEARWIINQMEATGQRPTEQEAANWRQGNLNLNQNYLPETNMYNLGFRTTNDRNTVDQLATPWIASRGGQPFGPYYQGSRQPTLANIQPPAQTGQIQQPQMRQYQAPEFQENTIEQEIQANPYEAYQVKFADFAESSLQNDTNVLNAITQKAKEWQLGSGINMQEADAFIGQLSPFGKEYLSQIVESASGLPLVKADGTVDYSVLSRIGLNEKYNQEDLLKVYNDIGNQAKNAIGNLQSGQYAEIPYFNEIMQSQPGKSTNYWYQLKRNQAFKNYTQQNAQAQTAWNARNVNVQDVAMQLSNLIRNGGFQPNVRQWLISNGDSLIQTYFQQNNGMNFQDWIVSYLGG